MFLTTNTYFSLTWEIINISLKSVALSKTWVLIDGVWVIPRMMMASGTQVLSLCVLPSQGPTPEYHSNTGTQTWFFCGKQLNFFLSFPRFPSPSPTLLLSPFFLRINGSIWGLEGQANTWPLIDLALWREQFLRWSAPIMPISWQRCPSVEPIESTHVTPGLIYVPKRAQAEMIRHF